MLSAIRDDIPRFETIFDLLSLDLCAQSFDAMGLVEPEPGGIQRALRGAMESPAYSESDAGARLATIADAFGHFSPEYCDRFVAWGRREFQYDPQQDGGVFFWRQLLLQAPREAAAGPLVTRASEGLRARLASAVLPARTPVTAWDKDRLAVHRARHGDTAMASPIEFVIATIGYVAFARSWQEALRAEPDPDAAIDQALRWARRRADALEMPAELIADPRSWPDLLTAW